MALKSRQRLGQYRIERKLAAGGFAVVYKARDTIEGIDVALKIPHAELVNKEMLECFRKEVRLTARLDHPNILPIKTAGQIAGHFVIVMPLGLENLGERIGRRMSRSTVMGFAEQLLEALACAHKQHIAHCDLKPENMVIFPGNRLRLTDFGIARIALRTLAASGSGTVGYIAPEQALGKPSLRSDVFAAGLVIYRMMSGELPEWPFGWPPPGVDRIRKNFHPDMVSFLRRALEVDEKKRYGSAVQMLDAFQKLKPRVLRKLAPSKPKSARSNGDHWKTIRSKQFKREYGRRLGARYECTRCHGAVSEAMQSCPWCGVERPVHKAETRLPARCPRCKRGVKLDWKFCSWCYGPAIGPLSERGYTDAHYERRCANPACGERTMLPFSRYCPWCRRKTAYRWKIEGSRQACTRCQWGILKEYWESCPWCGKECRRE